MSKADWVEVQEAARILSRHAGRAISADYVRLLAHKGKLKYKPKDRRQNLYYRADVESYPIRRKERPTAGAEPASPAP